MLERYNEIFKDSLEIISSLAIVIMGEGEGVSAKEKKWIAHSLLNRLNYPLRVFDPIDNDNDNLPDLEDILKDFDGYKRSFAVTNKIEREALKTSIKIAIECFNEYQLGIDPTNNSVFFITKLAYNKYKNEGKTLNDIFTRYYNLEITNDLNDNFQHVFVKLIEE